MSDRLTATELGIHPRELEALLWVRDALDPAIPDTELPVWMRLDMNEWSEIGTGDVLEHCGTACCIGGSMGVYLSGAHRMELGQEITREISDSIDHGFRVVTGTPSGSEALKNLFLSYRPSQARSREKAVAAIDRFLAGNTADPWLIWT